MEYDVYLSDIVIAWLKERFPELKPQVGFVEAIYGKMRVQIHLYHTTSVQFVMVYDNKVHMGLYTFLPSDPQFFNKIEKLIIHSTTTRSMSSDNVYYDNIN